MSSYRLDSVTGHLHEQVLQRKRRDKGQWLLLHDNLESHASLVVSSTSHRYLRMSLL
jgi:hypothetical protein